MIVTPHALSSPQKAELIYNSARAQLTDRLWRAALGEAPSADAAAPATANGGIGLDGLMALLDPHGAAAPVAAPAVASPVAGSNPLADASLVSLRALGPNQRFQPDLTGAASRTGIPAPALAAIVNAEAGRARDGSWQIYARNGRSSAAGLGQFLSGTWRGMAEMKGSWLNGVARARGWLDASGRVATEARSALLALRYDATASINTIADYARHNLDGLRKRGIEIGTGIEAIAQTAYLGHYLGLADATRFLRNQIDPARARQLLAAQIGAGAAAQRIAAVGDAVTAHRDWFLAHASRNLTPGRFES